MYFHLELISKVQASIKMYFCFLFFRFTERISSRVAGARVFQLPLPDAGRRHERLPAGRSRRERKARFLNPRLSSQSKQGKLAIPIPSF